MSCSGTFYDAKFQEILLPSSGKLNDYVTHINSKYEDLN